MRVEFDPEVMGSDAFYRFMTSVVVPRPIAWVSTITPDGTTENLAPHSFFSIASTDPPIVQFTSIGRKDSLRNVEDTGEFVVNFSSEPLLRMINATATDFPRTVSEFDVAGIEREPSLRVRPARVAASPVVLECRSHTTLRMGNSTLVFGRVLHAAAKEEYIVDGRPGSERLRPLTKLGGDEWGTLGSIIHLNRIPYEEPEGNGSPPHPPQEPPPSP
ncbi:flavin reductase [Streptomyces regensis]|uniref:Flavin reductase family protein n=1 Tax=Streptomyces flaveolus TaxID=67297 RepID=A0ABV3AJ29_9ACTN|nr:flavin reductase family protein [Streptomyces antibioticus]KMS91362.1 flavin reductase [Streptomyces regensis]KOG75219.1 flavin reductase [Streptomyces antibioticus]